MEKYLPPSNGCYFKPKLRGDGIYLEQIEYKEWYESTEKLINQCRKLFCDILTIYLFFVLLYILSVTV